MVRPGIRRAVEIIHEEGAPESWQATHGPWSAHVVMPLPITHVADMMKQLAWEHDKIGAIAPSVMPARDMPDTMLFAARLARGLTLLTQGTAYDIATQQYLNPSDWQDRGLEAFFSAEDHVVMHPGDHQAKPDVVWCYSLGLSKFCLDELETFCPRGTSDRAARELLVQSVREIIRNRSIPQGWRICRPPSTEPKNHDRESPDGGSRRTHARIPRAAVVITESSRTAAI